MKRIVSIAMIFIAYLNGRAQYESAITLGTMIPENTLQGTARFVGVGGIMGTVGGDISNLSGNPAGLAMFSRSEFEISPTFQLNHVNTNYQYLQGSTTKGSFITESNQARFTIGSVGVVIANRRSEKETLRASNISIGINRTANFNRVISFASRNNVYSYSNYLSDQATYYNFPASNQFPYDGDYTAQDIDFSRATMSRQAQLSLYDNTAGYYIDPIPYKTGKVIQDVTKKITGGISELSFAWSGNIKDKFYVGVALGIPFLSYRTELLFREDNADSTYASPSGFGKYQSMDLTENDLLTGTGVNLKLGGLYKVDDHLRVSAFIHTPTYYGMTNNYAVGMTTRYQNSTNPASVETPELTFSYITPMKAGFGASYVFNKNGFIGAEYEFTNNMSTKIDANSSAANSFVNSIFHNEQINTHKFKLGGELAIDIFRIRAGYNYTTGSINPYYRFRGINNTAQTISGGIGVRGKSTSFDLAFMRNQYQDANAIYSTPAGDESFRTTQWTTSNQLVATFNYRF